MSGCLHEYGTTGIALPHARTDKLTLPPGYTAVSIPVTLNRPTQMINAPDGRIWIAQLNGGERDGTGQTSRSP
ncbi:MAG: hypothetical protein R3E31_16930 [Chloroflexota bacterium]